MASMKFFRTITVIMIMALATSPALAAICATSCASQSVMSTVSAVHSDDMSGMVNCHEASMNKDKAKSDMDKSSTEHKSCNMGAGCHFAQATPIDSSSKYALINSTSVAFFLFDSVEKSVNLSRAVNASCLN